MTSVTKTDKARQAAGLEPAPPGKELSPIQQAVEDRILVVRSMLPAFSDALRSELDAKRTIRDAITALRTVPALAECTQASFLGALMTAAQLDLRPNVAALGHGWVLPFEDRKRGITIAQWILGYKGMVTIAGRSGITIIARTIYENDQWRVRYGLNEDLYHEPELDPSKRGGMIAHYAVAGSKIGKVWTIMSDLEVQAVRDKSPGYRFGGPDNPWRKDYGPMARKTPVRRLFPFIPTDSPELAMAIESDEKIRESMDADAILSLPEPEQPLSDPEPAEREVITVDLPDEEPEISQPAPPTEQPRRRTRKPEPEGGLTAEEIEAHERAIADESA